MDIEEQYKSAVREALKDGNITFDEREVLMDLQQKLGIDFATMRRCEKEVKEEIAREKAEAEHLAEEKRREEQRLAEERRLAEEARIAEEWRLRKNRLIKIAKRCLIVACALLVIGIAGICAANALEARSVRIGAAKRASAEASLKPQLVWALPRGVKLEMVYCLAGSFKMGSPWYEWGRGSNETLHRVTLTKPFWIGKYEVTQSQYLAVMGNNPSKFQGNNRPVENVSWYDAVAFCEKLNALTEGKRPAGYKFSLPTEAQWEYACRAGTTTALNNGKKMRIAGLKNAPALDKVGWYGGNCGRDWDLSEGYDISGWSEKQYDDKVGGTHPVGQKGPNAWGIYDMHGNVCEWCRDWYGKYDDETDPIGAESGAYRVTRGGGWYYRAMDCRTAVRYLDAPSTRDSSLGFRVALVPVQ